MQPNLPIRGTQPYFQQSQQPPQYPISPQQPQYGPPQPYPTNPHYGMQQQYPPAYPYGAQQNPPSLFQTSPQNPSSYSMAHQPNQYPGPHPYSSGYQPAPSSTCRYSLVRRPVTMKTQFGLLLKLTNNITVSFNSICKYPVKYLSDDIDRSQDATIFLFDSKKIRNQFIRKVYAILFVQMLVTIALMALMIFVMPIKEWVQAHRYLFWVAIAITFSLMIIIGCFTGPRRKFPLNVILLSIFTIAEAFLLGVISISKDTTYVLYSAGITVAIVLAITIFAMQTKIDFTYLTGGILILSIVMLAFGIMVVIIRSKILNLIYCCVGVLVFSIFLLIDTQLMLGGNHSYSISPEDYIFAALNLYVDIVQIFMMVLGIFSNSD